jgi:ABC-type sulfate transport system substrate-binding protein
MNGPSAEAFAARWQELDEARAGWATALAKAGQLLEQQTATAEVLKVINSSLTDVPSVFNAIVKSVAHCFSDWRATSGRFLTATDAMGGSSSSSGRVIPGGSLDIAPAGTQGPHTLFGDAPNAQQRRGR